MTVVEVFDSRCPPLPPMTPVIKTFLAEDLSVRLVYKDLPILGKNR